MSETVRISELMAASGVAFGTSGARGTVEAMTDPVCYAYSRAFLQALADGAVIQPGAEVVLAGDLRASTGRILAAVARAVQDAGYRVTYAGRLPSPAVAFFAMQRGAASIMVTGSHIPDDRNGIKFNRPDGEVLKSDEAGIREQVVSVARNLFDAGMDSIAFISFTTDVEHEFGLALDQDTVIQLSEMSFDQIVAEVRGETSVLSPGQADEAQAELKKELMAKIFEANVELRRQRTQDLGGRRSQAQHLRVRQPLAAVFKKHGVWQKRQQPVTDCAHRNSLASFHRLVSLLARIDDAIKGGSGIDPWTMIEQAVLRLRRHQRSARHPV